MTAQKTFRIRKSFLIPLGLLLLLTVVLLVVCIIQGQAIAKTLILAFLILPLVALFTECVYRRVVVDDHGVTAYRLFRKRQILFSDVTGLESVRVRSRVFITLVVGDDDFLIISNSYAGFLKMMKNLVGSVPEETVTEETRLLLAQPPVRHADTFTVWFAVAALVYILIAQFRV